MIKIDANGIRTEAVKNFSVICDRCGSRNTIVEIGGAEEFGEVGIIEVSCNDCCASEYSNQAAN